MRKCYVIFAAAMLLLSSGVDAAGETEKYKDIEIVEPGISVGNRFLARDAYLHMTVKNNGDREIENLAVRISYYGEGGYLIQKNVIKNALNDPVPPGEERSYKTYLRGDFVNRERDQYPYSKKDKVCGFDVKVADVKYGK